MVTKETQAESQTPTSRMPKVDVKRRECTLSDEMQKLLLRQLKHELLNHNIYLTFANYFGTRGFVKLEEYFKLRAQEEYEHHSWINYWLNRNDVEFVYPAIEKYTEQIDSMEFPFLATVDLEVQTTKMVYDMVNQAFDEEDYATYNWLMSHDSKTGMLVDEQVEEESISRTVRDIALSDDSWLRKENAILSAYKNRNS